MNYGFIYCLENQAMPGIYKIGRTDRSPAQRCKELSASTSAPTYFEVLFYVELGNPVQVERDIHLAFEENRVSLQREFFKCPPFQAYEWLRCNADFESEWLSNYMQYLVMEGEAAQDAARAIAKAKEGA